MCRCWCVSVDVLQVFLALKNLLGWDEVSTTNKDMAESVICELLSSPKQGSYLCDM